VALLVGIPGDWRYPAYPDRHFAQYVAQFDRVPRGMPFTIPINPHGIPMMLIKH
jgi:hypothetical protein